MRSPAFQRFFYCILSLSLFVTPSRGLPEEAAGQANGPIYISFLWNMHQPIYYPTENVLQTEANSRYTFSVVQVHTHRVGPYTTFAPGAVQKGITAGLQHLVSQVTLSGSLIENLDILESGGTAAFSGWKANWSAMKSPLTTLGNPRLDLLGREVRLLVNTQQSAGRYTVRFAGAGLASGVYLYRLTAGNSVQMRKMALIR